MTWVWMRRALSCSPLVEVKTTLWAPVAGLVAQPARTPQIARPEDTQATRTILRIICATPWEDPGTRRPCAYSYDRALEQEVPDRERKLGRRASAPPRLGPGDYLPPGGLLAGGRRVLLAELVH